MHIEKRNIPKNVDGGGALSTGKMNQLGGGALHTGKTN